MKIVTWNIEWMNHWFRGNSTPLWGSKRTDPDGVVRGRYTEGESKIQASKASNVINSINPDLLCIQEGPSSIEEMNLFISDYLSDGAGAALYEPIIGKDGSSQKMYVLRRIAGPVSAIDYAIDQPTEDLMTAWDADVNGDMFLQAYDFTRLPLVIEAEITGGRKLKVIVLHTKSKYVHGGEDKWNDLARRQEFIVDALLARRRISAEGFRLRTYLDALLQADLNSPIVIVGDFNDGPGRDFFERSYLTHNVTDIVLGSTFYPALILTHPILQHVPVPSQFTSRFDDYVDDIADRPLLLDHILVSPSLKDDVTDAGIAHNEHESEIDGSGSNRIERPSDHRPVWIELSN